MISRDGKKAWNYIDSACLTRRVSPLVRSSGRSSGSERLLPHCTSKVYCNYAARLKSFERWPHLGRLSALEFSKAGFYYTNCGDAVTCFCCGLTLSQWTRGIQPATVHAELSGGKCAYIDEASRRRNGGVDCRAFGATEFGAATPQPPRSSSVNAAATSAVGATSTVRPTTAASVSVASEIVAGVVAGDDSIVITKLNVPISAIVSSASKCCQGHPSPITACGSHSRHDDRPINYELYRIGTYANRWEYSNIVGPQELASAGFYYAGPGDRVQCAFCQGLLRNWEPGDRAMALHAEHFTYCRFVQGHDVGNVPVPFFSLEDDHVAAVETKTTDEADASLGIYCAVPKNPDFAVESRRQATFITWPGSMGSVTADQLAKAGFFYLGSGKLVKCFHCDGTIESWPEDADPWMEHARRYPTCTFVSQVKGRTYVERIGSNTAGNACDTRSATFAVDPREIRARVDTPKVRILLHMDYPIDLLREVVQKRLAATGDDHESSEALLAHLFAVHDEKQRALKPAATQGQLPSSAVPVVLVSPAASTCDPREVGARGSLDRTDNIALATTASVTNAFDNDGAAVVAGDSAARWEPLVALPSVGVDRHVDEPRLKASEENAQIKMQLTCKICMDGLVGIVFTPCGHFVCCPACAPALTACPICRVSIRGTVRCML